VKISHSAIQGESLVEGEYYDDNLFKQRKRGEKGPAIKGEEKKKIFKEQTRPTPKFLRHKWRRINKLLKRGT